MSKNHTNIPLHCSICPKNPQFSDVSHLLTHTSSKAHLSNYFKLKIRAASELTAKVQLDNFEDWYDNYDLERLLSERLASKDQKKAAKDRKVRNSKTMPGPAKVKKENENIHDNEANLAPMFRAPVPRMHLWPTTTNTNMSNNTSTSNSDMGSEWDHSAVYATPTSRRQIPGYTLQKTPSAVETASVSTNLITPLKEEGADAEILEKLSDSAKLKGVFWPGMDLFDSATAEMKRMRNQRKDGSILELMMAASAEVQPTEISYHPDGAFRTSRNIFGPLSTETSPKRRTRKAALTDVSVNVPRLRAGRPPRDSVRSPEKRQIPARMRQPAGQLALQPTPTLNPLAFGARFTPSNEEDEEFRMTMEEMGAKKRSFSVFQDAPEISPGRTESPLEDHRFDFSDGASNSFTNTNIDDHVSPTPVVKPTAMRMFSKDNGQSDVQGRRTVSTPHHGFPAQMFFENASMYNPLYSHHPRSFSFGGDHSDLSQISQEHKPMNGFVQGFHGNFNSVSHDSRLPSNHLHLSGSITHSANVNMPHFGM
ncbi:hypothetical protein SS1G_02908 [Sclerotinia sclerotiorum 1980 UF-70]|uniref:Uncharacterized protein n=2 Tax=Sclerotinia sclerotiorum (strain ATCC 18683 / 1980 / Ss-1) TaxID=665079 RepID=A7EC70_SCLS1|nr:hypothetical protein SS1G_02908 [Sclerotinia sclerotiorum 1980 UF-70]APA09036.1 hypothetical protein sscle_04g038060 [Sclerotinia sclerotiorum 1980 UF-70]EDO00049.1 hypothetical protein SS1G_02908 [Sclerotinia sclerotiorum 1980 UF-70]